MEEVLYGNVLTNPNPTPTLMYQSIPAVPIPPPPPPPPPPRATPRELAINVPTPGKEELF
jgi:hypothetical protein